MVPVFFNSSVYLTIIKRKGHANGRLKIFEQQGPQVHVLFDCLKSDYFKQIM